MMFEPSFGQNLTAIVGLPVAAWLTALGTGLAIERVARATLPNALLLPLGLAGGIVLSYALYALGASDVVPVVLLVLVSLAGLAFARGGLRSRLNPGLPAVAGIFVFLFFMLPVLVTGHWLWVGYNFDNDTSVQFLLTAHLKTLGTQMVPQVNTGSAVIDTYLATAYPLGAHAELATLSGLLHTGPEVVYQAYLSVLAALIALTVAATATPAIGSRRAAVLGIAAASANLFFQYTMQGNIKEIATAAMTVAAFALIAEAVRAKRSYPGVAVSAVPLAATLCTYGAAGAPYVLAAIGGVALTLVVNARRLPRPSWIGPALLGAALIAVLSIPALVGFSTLYHVAQGVVGSANKGVSTSVLGQLLRPLPLSQISGVWLAGDYRQDDRCPSGQRADDVVHGPDPGGADSRRAGECVAPRRRPARRHDHDRPRSADRDPAGHPLRRRQGVRDREPGRGLGRRRRAVLARLAPAAGAHGPGSGSLSPSRSSPPTFWPTTSIRPRRFRACLRSGRRRSISRPTVRSSSTSPTSSSSISPAPPTRSRRLTRSRRTRCS